MSEPRALQIHGADISTYQNCLDSTMADSDHLEALYRTSDQVRAAGLTHDEAVQAYSGYLRFVAEFAAHGDRLLDVGCGCGWSTYLFAQQGFHAMGIDLNPAAFEPPSGGRCTLSEGSGTAIPYPDASFDAAASYQCLEHVPDPARMLDEMVRVVRPGGVVCVVGPNLLGMSVFARALTRYVWRNRPIKTIFVRSPAMPRHPSGNTLPEIVVAGMVALGRTVRKAASSQAEFTMRVPDLRPPFQSDNDALYLCNPMDLTRYLRGRGCEVLRDVALGRPTWSRMLAGGTWVAARTPTAAWVAPALGP